MRKEFLAVVAAVVVANILGAVLWTPSVLWSFLLFGPIIILGIQDMFKTSQVIRYNFPILGRMRYVFEAIRPEINQYFVESNTDGRPYNREERSVVYQRAKGVNDTVPFGTQKDVYEVGYEWLDHSLVPTNPSGDDLRVTVGGPDCKKPYSASVLNISAMSYGALSGPAIEALNGGAKDGGFAHNTGEGGISPYHKKHGGDLIWQIGTGYFGCRSESGGFDGALFKENSSSDQVKMIEIKLSQGAKPGHGGILPAAKVTKEISEIRGVPMGRDVNSPPAHTAFSTPIELVNFVKELRDLSGGKPIGFKICIGKKREFLSICKAMVKTGIKPDFIVVDGGEGGTGAAPIEFTNHIGCPGIEALILVQNCLTGFGLRDDIKIIATGKVTAGFGAIQRMALGADIIYSARAMMMSLGCIQALRCNHNDCPTGVATQKKEFSGGLHIASKRKRVTSFHHQTVHSIAHMLGAMGINHSSELRPWHINRRISPSHVHHFGEIYKFIEKDSLLDSANIPSLFKRSCSHSSADTFHYKE
jgi:glutamate synthase domain-containing protein 2